MNPTPDPLEAQLIEILKEVQMPDCYSYARIEEATTKLIDLMVGAKIDELRTLLNTRTFEAVITPQAIQDRLTKLRQSVNNRGAGNE